MDTASPHAQDGNLDPVEIAAMTSQIVSAYLAQHKVGAGEIPTIIETVHTSLAGLGRDIAPAPEKPVPMMPIKKTVTEEYLVSLEDGKRYKSLKRHLTGRGLTPAEYRDKWGLPRDYPMVAPAYARHRSELAKSLGLGQQRRRAAEASGDAQPAPSAPRRGRRTIQG